MGRQSEGRKAVGIALPAILAALALILLYIACLSPTGRWGWAAMAGLMPMAAVASFGVTSGFLCWGGASILAFLLLPNKFYALLFSLLFGLYPILKAPAERIGNPLLQYGAKIAFFNIVLTVLMQFSNLLMMPELTAVLNGRTWILYLLGTGIFLVYDFGLTGVIRFYLVRIDRALRKSGRG